MIQQFARTPSLQRSTTFVERHAQKVSGRLDVIKLQLQAVVDP